MNFDPMLVRLQEDPETGELFLPIPGAWLEALDWRHGDVMDWTKRSNGDLELTNRTKQERDRAAMQASVDNPDSTSINGGSHDDSD